MLWSLRITNGRPNSSKAMTGVFCMMDDKKRLNLIFPRGFSWSRDSNTIPNFDLVPEL